MAVMLSDLLRNLTFNRSAHCTQVSDQCPLGLLFISFFFYLSILNFSFFLHAHILAFTVNHTRLLCNHIITKNIFI